MLFDSSCGWWLFVVLVFHQHVLRCFVSRLEEAQKEYKHEQQPQETNTPWSFM